MPEHEPPLPLSQRALLAEAIKVKRELDEMAAEDAVAPPEPPLLCDPILYPTVEDRIAEIRRRHGEGPARQPKPEHVPARWQHKREKVTPEEVLRLVGIGGSK